MPPSLRLTREQVDEQIVDRAAALFAQHGFANTSLQQVADAVGYSKAGLLHHYPSKDALHAAAESLTQARLTQILDRVRDLPLGPARDRRGLEELADWALMSPGQTALALSFVTHLADSTPFTEATENGVPVLQVFGVDPCAEDPARLIRVISALTGLLVTSLVASHTGAGRAWRDHVVAAAVDALGHRRPSAAAPTHPDQVED
ncbi:helix-turn-helix domain-containing protein [Modestobacter sp. NPDC049651]|uniref:TetR/AcrR family transcriptional regulator n=1 Tax=unclassified Modestobacter TaxID=2643866 RepID=UPI0033FE765E